MMKTRFNFLFLFALSVNMLFAQNKYIGHPVEKNFSVNTKGTGLFQIVGVNNKKLVSDGRRVFLSDKKTDQVWRKTNLKDGCFFLDLEKAPSPSSRLRATAYSGLNLTKQDIEGVNDDVRWRIIELTNGKVMLQHKSSEWYLFAENDSVFLTENRTQRPGIEWELELKKIDLESIESPIILMGDDKHGFRDPAVIKHNGVYYMYYSFVKTEEDEKIYWYVAWSKSYPK